MAVRQIAVKFARQQVVIPILLAGMVRIIRGSLGWHILYR
jgi:hypothetical protein